MYNVVSYRVETIDIDGKHLAYKIPYWIENYQIWQLSCARYDFVMSAQAILPIYFFFPSKFPHLFLILKLPYPLFLSSF